MKAHFLLRAPSPDMAAAELTHIAREPIDWLAAVRQHAAYAEMLRRLGGTVQVLPALAGHPDCAFVEDVAIVLPEAYVATRPGAPSRRGEVESIVAAFPDDDRARLTLTAPARLDGGDVLRIGRTLHVGLSSRTNAIGISQLGALVAPLRYAVKAVPVAGALHLKTAVTVLPDGRIVLNPAWVSADAFDAPVALTVGQDEPFGANTLTVGTTVLAQANASRLAGHLDALGYQVQTVDIAQFNRVEAGLTCLSLCL